MWKEGDNDSGSFQYTWYHLLLCRTSSNLVNQNITITLYLKASSTVTLHLVYTNWQPGILAQNHTGCRYKSTFRLLIFTQHLPSQNVCFFIKIFFSKIHERLKYNINIFFSQMSKVIQSRVPSSVSNQKLAIE